MSAAASAKHENFVMSTSYTARSGRRQTTRSTLLMYVVHLGRLKAPRKAAGQMDLLTVPSADGVDSKVIQVEEALSAPTALGFCEFNNMTTPTLKTHNF